MVLPTEYKQLLGKKCWRAWDGFLPAIFFELGEKKNSTTGEYSICFDICPWDISLNDSVLTHSKMSRSDILPVLQKFIGQEISSITISSQKQTVQITFGALVITAYLEGEQDTLSFLFPLSKAISFTKKSLREREEK
jgi:hypothetical protein